MYRLMIVDDERIIREGLAAILNWETYGVTVAGFAKNGLEAYNTIVDIKPDIIITDIKMPGIDGIELIRRCRQREDDILFVVLSGYGEFELANQAMYYGVRHYLLKPCREQKLIETVREIIQELDERRALYAKLAYMSEGSVSLSISPSPYRGEGLADVAFPVGAKEHSVALKVKQYVSEHIDDPNLSLKMIARHHLYLHPAYVSTLFRHTTGERFTQYLLRERMERAKALIAVSDEVRIYEIALLVGYGDNPQYFSQLFKKYTGISPRDFKRK